MWQISFGPFQLSLKFGILIPALLLLPNLLWMAFPGLTHPERDAQAPLWLTVSENLGRLAVLLLPVFFMIDLDRRYSQPVLMLMGLCLLLYYAAWLRYFLAGRAHEMLSAPLLGVPLPMAVFPILLLILSSYLMHSWIMLGAAVFFGVAHLWVSAIGL